MQTSIFIGDQVLSDDFELVAELAGLSPEYWQRPVRLAFSRWLHPISGVGRSSTRNAWWVKFAVNLQGFVIHISLANDR
jgi:hypothetical protein